MRRKPKTIRALLLGVAAALVALLAVAIPAAAHHGHDNFGGEPAGTIASFEESSGVLTINLAGGGSVSGLVSRWTRLDCGHPGWSGSWHWGDRGRGRGHGVRARHGDDHGHHWGDPSCTTADLTPGATVENAVLGLANGKAFFVKVELEGTAPEGPTTPPEGPPTSR